MGTRTLFMTMLLAVSLMTGCGSDEPERQTEDRTDRSTEGPAAIAEAAQSLDLSCEFEPKENPDAIGLGIVRLLGENTSDVRIDSLSVTMELPGEGSDAEVSTSVVYFMPGEELAQWAPVFDEYDGELDGGCEVTEVSGGHYGGAPLIEPEGGACEVSGEPGDWDLVADFSQIADVPYDEAKFVGVVTEVDGKRVAMDEDELEAGALELELSSTLEEEPSCSIRYVRDL